MLKSTAEWKFFIRINISELELKASEVERHYENLYSLCAELKEKFPMDHCMITVRLINNTLQEIKANNVQFSQISDKPRSKRGLFNAVGTLQKFLFGTLDSQDGEKYDQAIKTLTSNDLKIFHSLEHKISVIDDAIKMSSFSLNKTFSEINTFLSQIQNQIYDEARLKQSLHLFDEAANILTIVTEYLISEQRDLYDIIQEAMLGHIDKHLIRSKLFLSSLQDVQLETLNNFKLPLKPSIENLPIISQISKVTPLLTDGNLVFQINVPLVSSSYNLYRLTSIPAKFKNETYYYIKIDSQYLAINEGQERYIFLKQEEYNNCNQFQNGRFICDQNFLSHSIHQRSCIISLHMGEKVPHNCELRIFNLQNEMWQPLLKSNTWLFLVPNMTALRIICNETAYSTSIKGSGILELRPNCKARTPMVALEAKSEVTKAEAMSYHVGTQFLQFLEEMRGNLSVELPKLKYPKIILDNSDLESLSISLSKIDTDDQEIFEDPYSHYSPTPNISLDWYSFFASFAFIVIILIICRILKRFLKCKISLCPRRVERNQEGHE